MRQYKTVCAYVIAVSAVCVASAAAKDKAPDDAKKKKKNVFVEAPADQEFGWFWVNGRITDLKNATPKQIVEKLAPGLPIVGVRNLPSDVRFDISFELGNVIFDLRPGVLPPGNPPPEAFLADLGEKLGLEIEIRDTAADFVIVRNDRTGVPKTWEVSSDEFGGGIKIIDERDALYRAKRATMTQLVQFIADFDDRPVLNQCALEEKYNFSFAFPDHDGLELLKSFGFDAKIERRTAKAVVVRKRAADD
ncbi:MAG TPA: hypothetical protein VHB99_03395 [Pirellulales bacterium]|nr:hypothetical protein [Pirellulales bacterium]